MQWRPAGDPAGAVCEQPDQSGALQSGWREPGQAAAETTDPCGQITYDVKADSDETQTLAKIDYQTGTKHSFFGRYLLTRFKQEPGYAGGTDNVLNTSVSRARTCRPTRRPSARPRCSARRWSTPLRFAVNKGKVDVFQTPFFSPKDIGANLYSYVPGYMTVNVTGGFLIYDTNTAKALFLNDTYQLAEDLTIVRGNHQFGVGANLQYFKGDYTSTSRANGNWIINGSATGLGLADLLVGRVTSVEHGGPNRVLVNNWHMGLYAQDSWRASTRVTLNLGARWEPYFGQNVVNNAIAIFKMENFQQGIKSKVFLNAPAGLIYPGDEGFPPGQTGLDVQWWNLAPRLGVAWDVHGDGRLAVRSSYAMGVRLHVRRVPQHQLVGPAVRQPLDDGRSSRADGRPVSSRWGRSPSDRDRAQHPVRALRRLRDDGSQHQLAASPVVERHGRAAARLGVGRERQLPRELLGSAVGADRAESWRSYMGLGPCTLRNGVTYPVCSTNANLNFRRVLYQQNPMEAAFIGGLDLHTDVGLPELPGPEAVGAASGRQRREPQRQLHAVTLLRHRDDQPLYPDERRPTWTRTDPAYDAGYCDQDRRHLATLTAGYETPELDNAALTRSRRTGGCRGSSPRSRAAGSTSSSGIDNAFTGIGNQRPNKVSDDFYAGGTLTNYFNRVGVRAAGAPARWATCRAMPSVGPNYWNIDLAVSKLFAVTGTQRVEFRLEAFNLLNHFNWGNPGKKRELQRGHVRPHHDASRRASHHPVRHQVRLLADSW